MADKPDVLLDVRSLTKTYPRMDRPAVNRLSLRINRGEVFGFVGPNGAGKTTTIKILLGLARPDGGGGALFGLDMERDSVAIRRRIGFMSGDVRLWSAMRGRDVLLFLLGLHGGGNGERVKQLCRRFEVPLDRKVKTYSTGQKQQLALIAALGHDSDLLVLDEPTKGLDPSKKAQFLEIIETWPEHGGAVMISSHVLSEIEGICTRVGFIRDGKLLGEDEIDAVRSRVSNVIVAAFDTEIDESELRLPGVREVRRRGAEYILSLSGDGREVLKALAELPLESLRYHSASLDDLYEGLYLDSTVVGRTAGDHEPEDGRGEDQP